MHSHQNTAGLQQPYNPRTTRVVLEAGNHSKCTHLNLLITQLANHYYIIIPVVDLGKNITEGRKAGKLNNPPPPLSSSSRSGSATASSAIANCSRSYIN